MPDVVTALPRDGHYNLEAKGATPSLWSLCLQVVAQLPWGGQDRRAPAAEALGSDSREWIYLRGPGTGIHLDHTSWGALGSQGRRHHSRRIPLSRCFGKCHTPISVPAPLESRDLSDSVE